MTNRIDTAAANALRTFALDNGEVQFAHLVTAAINGEEWAVERVNRAIGRISIGDGFLTLWCSDEELLQMKIGVIRTTDTTRPDGAIARRIEI